MTEARQDRAAQSPQTVAEWSTIFRERFRDVVAIIENHGATFTISSAGDRAASPVPGQAMIVVRPRDDRGFGFTMSETQLSGLRGRRYRLDDLASPEANQLFIDELTRRIRSPGHSRTQVNGHIYGSKTGKWGKSKRRASNEPWSQDAY